MLIHTWKVANTNRYCSAVFFAGVLLAMPSGNGYAYTINEHFSLAGFGSFGVSHTDTKESHYVPNGLIKNGIGDGKAWTAGLDSRLGVQAIADYGDISGIVQIIAQQNYNGKYYPQVEWANIKYTFNPKVSVRVGRIILPTLMHTETAKIGYAGNWVRVPSAAYNFFPVSNNDGVDATLTLQSGSIRNSTTVHAGFTKLKSADEAQNWGQRMVGFVNDTEIGNIKTHVGYLHFDLKNDTFEKVIAAAPAILQPLLKEPLAPFHSTPVNVLSLGTIYDNQKLFVSGEINWMNNAVAGRKRGWYVHAGHRFGALTPYAFYGQERMLKASQVVTGIKTAQNHKAVGLRWDFTHNMDMKVQFEQLQPIGPYGGSVLWRDRSKIKEINIFSMMVNFVF